MAANIFAFIVHNQGKADESAFEMISAAEKILPGASLTALATGSGEDLDAVCREVAGLYAEVWKFNGAPLSYPNAELIRPLLTAALPKGSILLLPHNTLGMDLGPGLSIKMDAAYVSDVVAVESIEGTTLKVVRQELNGQVSAHMACDTSGGAILTIRSGVFEPAVTAGRDGGRIIDKSSEIPELSARRKFVEVIRAEVGDVDITREEVLVSVGRGIGDKENIPIVEELAEAIGGAVSCSRPIVDAKWLEKSRQVGTSGKTVKPKVYIALGISGAFQHLGGLKGNPFTIAVNKNPKAPIFQVANVGVVADLLELVPELTDKVLESK